MRGSKQAKKCVQLIWQHGLAHDGGTPAFVASDIWIACHTSLVLLVLRSFSLLFGCLLFASLLSAFSLAMAVIYAALSPERKADFLALDRALTSAVIQTFWLGNDLPVFMITLSSKHLLIKMYILQDVMLLSWVEASLNICQSVHSVQTVLLGCCSFICSHFNSSKLWFEPLYLLGVSKAEEAEKMRT